LPPAPSGACPALLLCCSRGRPSSLCFGDGRRVRERLRSRAQGLPRLQKSRRPCGRGRPVIHDLCARHDRRARADDRQFAWSASPMDDQGRCVRGSPLRLGMQQDRPWGSAGALPHNWPCSELESGAGVHHRYLAAGYRADSSRGDPFQVGAGGRGVGVPSWRWISGSGIPSWSNSVARVPKLVLAPTSAQAPLGRPHGYADEDEKVFARWDVGGE
jgi:hypothetical protein